MSNRLITVCLIGILATSCKPQLKTGQSTLSPDKKWFVHLETAYPLTSTNATVSISIYDTAVYPALMTNLNPSGTPTASFNVPVKIDARSADLKWNTNNTVLRIEQPAPAPPIYYEVNLTTLSFTKIDK
jgi:hypothetical protein